SLVQRVMARSAVCTSPPHHWGAPRLGDGTTSLCLLHHLVGPYHTHPTHTHTHTHTAQPARRLVSFHMQQHHITHTPTYTHTHTHTHHSHQGDKLAFICSNIRSPGARST